MPVGKSADSHLSMHRVIDSFAIACDRRFCSPCVTDGVPRGTVHTRNRPPASRPRTAPWNCLRRNWPRSMERTEGEPTLAWVIGCPVVWGSFSSYRMPAINTPSPSNVASKTATRVKEAILLTPSRSPLCRLAIVAAAALIVFWVSS